MSSGRPAGSGTGKRLIGSLVSFMTPLLLRAARSSIPRTHQPGDPGRPDRAECLTRPRAAPPNPLILHTRIGGTPPAYGRAPGGTSDGHRDPRRAVRVRGAALPVDRGDPPSPARPGAGPPPPPPPPPPRGGGAPAGGAGRGRAPAGAPPPAASRTPRSRAEHARDLE